MKRWLTISFTLVYLVLSTGLLFNEHLCMGRVKDRAMFKEVDEKCMAIMDMPQDMDDCCHDQWTLEIIEDDQQITSFSFDTSTSFVLLTDFEFVFEHLSIDEEPTKAFGTNSDPPDLIITDLNILYHNLKIPAVHS